MADDAQEERFRQHEELLQGLARLWAAQHEKNQSYDAIIQEQREMNRQQVEINQDIKTTLAGIQTLLARMLRPEANGRDAADSVAMGPAMERQFMLHRRLDEVAMNAWPALHQMLFDGWILRFAQGYTKRANSVNPLFESHLDVVDKIVACEHIFAAKGLPTVFRLTPFASPPQLDQGLAQRGYHVIDPTLVMHLDLQHTHVQNTPQVALRTEALHDWLPIFCRLSEEPLEQHRTHAAMLDLIPATRLLVSLVDAETVVACGMGVLEQDYFGLFNLVTPPPQRNRGYGARLVLGMLQWAREHQATQVYLQVVQSNTPARHVYTRLGFQEAYRYWYRIA